MNAPPGPEENLSLAAATRLRHDIAELDLIDRAKDNGAPWDLIGRALGMSKEEAKRHHKHLSAQVGRARRMQDNRGEEEAG